MKKFFEFKNFSKNKSKLKMILILTFLLFLYTTIYAFSYAKTTFSDISNSVLRLHVIANSDSDEDQNLKYIVRDKLLTFMGSICINAKSKTEAIEIANSHLSDFKKIANQTVQENGYSYDVDVQIGNFKFPTKTYGDISLPSGYYDALRVTIGEAKGQNWWCVMFPPLCFVDITSGVVPEDSKKIMKDNMGEEDFALISDSKSNSGILFKFKLLEFFGNNGFMTAKN